MKKIATALLSCALAAATLAGCAANAAQVPQESQEPHTAALTATAAASVKSPKYVFLFIGDGMSYPQIQSTSDYLGALKDADYWQAQPSLDDNQGAILDGPEYLNFMNFEAAGSAVTYDSNSFAPDSASTATSISTGHKTYSGSINVDETGTIEYETIAEQLKAQKGWEIGVITSVNLNHATPAAFYAHQASRSSYYEIGLELVESGFDYFAGGGLLKPTGSSGDQTDLYELAQEAGYTVAKTHAEADAIGTNTEKAIIIDEDLADSDAMAYELDRTDDMWALADYVAKGIEVLDNDTGFFMMCEGGKIDWACHANDCAAAIHDVMALEDCVAEAVAFYEDHPDETLIVVTGDHETGGLTIGYAETNYDTFLTNIAQQKISYAKFDSDYVAGYIEAGATYDQAMEDVAQLFGLERPGAALSSGAEAAAQVAEAEPGSLMLTAYEDERLREAYERTVAVGAGDQEDMTQEEYVHYGTYEPFTVTLTHLLNRKSGVDFSTYAHSGLTVPVFALGAGAEVFDGFYDNTEIYAKLAALTGVA